MKRLLTFLLLLGIATSAQAEIASHSLVSLRSGRNLSTLAFQPRFTTLAVDALRMEFASTPYNMVVDGSGYGLQGFMGNFFYDIQGQTYQLPTSRMVNDQYGIGYGFESFGLSYAGVNQDDGTSKSSMEVWGAALRLGRVFYLGGYSAKDTKNSTSQGLGVALASPRQYRIEYSTYQESHPTNGTSTATRADGEYQWGSVVLGVTHTISVQGTNKKWETEQYLAWQPDKGGFSMTLAAPLNGDPNYISGWSAKFGYLF